MSTLNSKPICSISSTSPNEHALWKIQYLYISCSQTGFMKHVTTTVVFQMRKKYRNICQMKYTSV